jgi:hypothetical protein
MLVAVLGVGCRGDAEGPAAPPTTPPPPPTAPPTTAPPTTAPPPPTSPPTTGEPVTDLPTATGASGKPRDERIGPPGSGRPVTDALVAGTCYDEVLDPATDPPKHVILAADCAGPHDAEVFVRVDLPEPPGTPYPGDEALDRESYRLCLVQFQAYVGRLYATSALRVSLLRPVIGSWSAGDRAVACSLYDEQLVPLVGSVRSSGR